MIRYQIFENDVTTVGGIVQRHTGSGQTFIWHGRLASNLGDKINCPACGSIGFIAPKGMRRPIDNMKQAPALNGDLCICKCNPPPELKHSQDTCRQNVTGGIIIDTSKTNSFLPISSENLSNLEYGQKFLLLDELTGEPLVNACYDIYKSGQFFLHGKSDEDGYTDVVTSEKEEEVEIIIHLEDGEDHEYCCKR